MNTRYFHCLASHRKRCNYVDQLSVDSRDIKGNRDRREEPGQGLTLLVELAFRDVSGTCTTAVKKNELEKRGFDVHLFNAMEPERSTLNTIKYHTHLLVSIPPIPGVGDLVLQHGELLRQELSDGNLQWLC
ncbi:uncharacterized protein LOC110808478 [Carica papaya]|uniref:uncharacterized protein LOC110808478 n=1 Tax=Carica papaya TaxID=3649 RepID=UPI000B8D14B6|nr:uncharacterized protein LOC110808478 [Carica papaya]